MNTWVVGLSIVIVSACTSAPLTPATSDGPRRGDAAHTIQEGASDVIIPALAVFAPYLGKTYRGVSTAPEFESEDDLVFWSAALGGKAVRATHALADGSYGGESLFYADQNGVIRGVYVGNVGFHTTAEVTPTDDGGWASIGAFSPNMPFRTARQTVTPVRDGFVVTSALVTESGEVQPGPSFRFVEDRDAYVTFQSLGATSN